jgi:hypothetical protein
MQKLLALPSRVAFLRSGKTKLGIGQPPRSPCIATNQQEIWAVILVTLAFLCTSLNLHETIKLPSVSNSNPHVAMPISLRGTTLLGPLLRRISNASRVLDWMLTKPPTACKTKLKYCRDKSYTFARSRRTRAPVLVWRSSYTHLLDEYGRQESRANGTQNEC